MDNKEKVLGWIDENQEHIVDLLVKLIRIPSVNPYFGEKDEEAREGRVQTAIKEYMEAVSYTHPTLPTILRV